MCEPEGTRLIFPLSLRICGLQLDPGLGLPVTPGANSKFALRACFARAWTSPPILLQLMREPASMLHRVMPVTPKGAVGHSQMFVGFGIVKCEVWFSSLTLTLAASILRAGSGHSAELGALRGAHFLRCSCWSSYCCCRDAGPRRDLRAMTAWPAIAISR